MCLAISDKVRNFVFRNGSPELQDRFIIWPIFVCFGDITHTSHEPDLGGVPMTSSYARDAHALNI